MNSLFASLLALFSITSTVSANLVRRQSDVPSASVWSFTISEGDICWDLAHYSGISLKEFQCLNPEIDCDHLQIGEKVNVLPPPCPEPYRVVKGDTLYKIAKAHNITVEELEARNPNINSNSLQIKWPICVKDAFM